MTEPITEGGSAQASNPLADLRASIVVMLVWRLRYDQFLEFVRWHAKDLLPPDGSMYAATILSAMIAADEANEKLTNYAPAALNELAQDLVYGVLRTTSARSFQFTGFRNGERRPGP